MRDWCMPEVGDYLLRQLIYSALEVEAMLTKNRFKLWSLVVGILIMMTMLLGPTVEIRLNPPEEAEAAATVLSRERSHVQMLRARGVELLNAALLDERELDKARQARSVLYDAEQLHSDEAQRFVLRVYQFMASELLSEQFDRFEANEKESTEYLLRQAYPTKQDWRILVSLNEKGPAGNHDVAYSGNPWLMPRMPLYQALGWGSAREEWMTHSGRTYAAALNGVVRKGERWGALAYGMTREPQLLGIAVGSTGKVFGSELNDGQLQYLEFLNRNRSADCAELVPVKAQLDRCTLAGRNLDGIVVHQFLHIWGSSPGPEGVYDVDYVATYFRTVRDALRPGGRLVVLDSNPRREVARQIMEKAGLREVSFGSPNPSYAYFEGGMYRAVYERP